ncbi:DUF2567 domain-containing protein [Blastococcus sp. SYSU DS0617]
MTRPGPPFVPPGQIRPAVSDRWLARQELRADLRPAVLLALALAGAGVPAGLLWWVLAPRADFRITADGPVVIGSPSLELLVADDAIFVLVMAVVGLLAGLAAWPLRRHRGVTILGALAVGATASGAVAWLVGEMLGEGPTEAELSEVGRVVTTGLDLGATAALAVAPFVAVLVYVLGVIVNADEGLGRTDAPSAPSGGSP